MPRGHEYNRQSGSGFKGESRGDASDVARARDRVGGKTEDREPEHFISRDDVGDVRTHCPNDTGNFIAKNSRIRSVAGIKSERLKHVTEIHARGFDFDQDLSRLALRKFKRRKAKRIEVTAFARFETQRQSWIEPLLGPRSAAIETPNITSFAA